MPSTPQERLYNAQSKWSSHSLENYDFVSEQICFCSPNIVAPKLIRVRGGAVESVTILETGECYDGEMWYETVDEVLDEIQRAISSSAHEVRVSYDNIYGFPTSVSIDYEKQISDDELHLLISDFKAY